MEKRIMMDAGDTAWAVAEAIRNLIEHVEAIAPPHELDCMRDEAKCVVFELCSKVMLADGKFDSGERELLQRLVNLGEHDGTRFLQQHTVRWDETSKTIPHFFKSAVTQDPDTARSMLREIQFIANNVAIGDGDFQAVERQTVKDYLAFLEESIAAKQQP